MARFATAFFLLLLALPAITLAADDIKLGEFIPVTPPQPAPETKFTDLDGKPASFADFHGKPAVVNLWATWCHPCLKEMPSLDRLAVALEGKLAVAAISEDRGGAARVQPFVDKMELKKLRIYLDPKSDVGHAFQVRGLPTSLVIDANGRVVGRVEGAAEWDSAAMKAMLKPFLQDEGGALKDAAR